ncbi:hypothetical protein [Aporhodopirellula aestuarii]|uniref:Uncharacterized protein n=1 Tax=Aporhodopirellula aestuarii TaxID=2950107 RepID=A0ABT0U4P5_9BACT|nr:hypothetical protein [Aporhodopirellula aestuarii]MCM2371879.1 hypothetical protein [Aporhodopirellula aestuarii]
MSPIIVVCLFLALGLAVASLLVMQQRRRLQAMQSIINQLVQKEFHHADHPPPDRPDDGDGLDLYRMRSERS